MAKSPHLDFRPLWRKFRPFAGKGIAMSKVRNRMIRDMQLAGLVEPMQKGYLRAVRQLTAFYLVCPIASMSDKALSVPIIPPA